MTNKGRYMAMSKPFTREELKYYLNVDTFNIGEKEFDAVDIDRIDTISSYAVLDMATRSKMRTRKDFKSAAEYEFYKAAIYDNALDEKYNLR